MLNWLILECVDQFLVNDLSRNMLLLVGKKLKLKLLQWFIVKFRIKMLYFSIYERTLDIITKIFHPEFDGKLL